MNKISRRQFVNRTAGITAGAALGALAARGQAESGARPNLLFIMTDQQHGGMMSCTGNATLRTPALDRMAAQGIRFERAYATNPVCVPSRISMATGMMPGRFGIYSNVQPEIPKDVAAVSLGNLIKRAGYDTFYGGKTHLPAALSPLKAGYDEFNRDQRDELPDACIEFIKRPRNRPFFAVASFINPHDICYAFQARQITSGEVKTEKRKPLLAKLYAQALEIPLDELPPLPRNYEKPRLEAEAIEKNMKPGAVTKPGVMREIYDDEDWRRYRWIYCRLTELVDEKIGRILDAVRDAGLEENTLIIFTSDHGDMDASHRLASKNVLYEESARVPLLIQYKGVIPPGVVDSAHLASTGLDILPTLCDYAGAVWPESLLGRSLRPVAEGKKMLDWREYVVSENPYGRMLRTKRFKYCLYDAGKHREQLIDMDNDPGEMENLAGDPAYRRVLARHRQFLRQWAAKNEDEKAASYLNLVSASR